MNKRLYYLIIASLLIIIFFLIKMLLQYSFFNTIKIAVINIFLPFLISFIIVYIFHPLLYWIEKNFSIKTWVTTLFLMFVNTVGIILLIEFILPIFAKQLANILLELPKYSEEFKTIIAHLQVRFNLNGDIINTLNDYINKISLSIGKSLVKFTTSTGIYIFKTFWIFIMIPLIIFVLMKDYGLIYNKLQNFLIRHQRSEWIHLLKKIDVKLGAYIRGQFIIMGYMFLGSFIPLMILGMPNAFIFSIIIALTNIIPYLGPYLGGIPLCIYAYFQSPYLLIASFLIILFMQQFDGNLGQPLVYGAQLKIHPLIVIIVMLIGSAIGGVIGLVVSVPIYIIFKETYTFFKPNIKNLKTVEKNL